MRSYEPPVIPDSLSHLYDNQFQATHEKFTNASLEDLLKDKPKAELHHNDDQSVRYVELLPAGDFDETESVVLFLPFANGYSDHMHIRARFMQDAICPDKKVVVFPSSTTQERAFTLSAEELSVVSSGEMAPIAEKYVRFLAAKKILNLDIVGYSLAMSGYSLGGLTSSNVGLKLSDYAEVSSVGIFDTPNVVQGRSTKELEKDFVKTGLFPFIKAVRDSKIDALNDAHGLIFGARIPGPRTVNNFRKFARDSKLPENQAILSSMTTADLRRTITQIREKSPHTKVLLSSAENTKIAPTKDTKELASEIDGVEYVEVSSGYGHEAGDNIVVHALLAKCAMRGVGF